MNINDNNLNWFEIPVDDMKRAKQFYERIFSIEMEEDIVIDMQMSFFPSERGNGKVGGALVKSELHKSNTEGVLVYLNADPDISIVMERIEEEGGVILKPKTTIPTGGSFIAMFLDTEGKRMGLHSHH